MSQRSGGRIAQAPGAVHCDEVHRKDAKIAKFAKVIEGWSMK
jgi:hypothetical protein